MAKIITFTNQKGGVGKTSLAMNFGVRLKMNGMRVLLVDMDPQCSLTYITGVDQPTATVYEVLLGQCSAADAIAQARECDILCASPKLSAADMVFTDLGKEFLLREALQTVSQQYDYIVIDSPPTLGILTVNILTAANYVIIPALADVFSLQGVGQLYATIQAVRKYCNPNLEITGIVLSRHTERFVLSRELHQMMEQTANQIGARVFESTIRESVLIREAQATRQSVFQYSPKSNQTADYDRVAMECLRYIEQNNV